MPSAPPPPEVVKKFQLLAAALIKDAERAKKLSKDADAADKYVVEIDNENK